MAMSDFDSGDSVWPVTFLDQEQFTFPGKMFTGKDRYFETEEKDIKKNRKREKDKERENTERNYRTSH